MSALTDRQQLDALWSAMGKKFWLDGGKGIPGGPSEQYYIRLFPLDNPLDNGELATFYGDSREECIAQLIAYQVAGRLDQ